MLPNKLVASIFVGLLMAQVFALNATAQNPILGSDLVVEDVDVGRPRVAGVQGRINITIRNQGTTDFTSPTGWQIFVGLNGGTNADCIEPGDSNVGGTPTTVASPCYITMAPGRPQPGDGSNASSIPAGQARRYTLMWNASTDNVRESAAIHIEIANLGAQPGSNSGSNCSGPDTVCDNNKFILHGVAIGRLGVRAVPDRQIAPGKDDTNDQWSAADITDACPEAPNTVQRGCKVRAGKTIVATYLVKNVGTVEDSYTPSLLVDDYYYERGYIFAFAPHNFTLGKAQQREVRLTIVVPENETATAPGQANNATNVNFANERVRWSSSRAPHIATDTPGSPGCTDPQNAPYCVNPTLPSFTIDYRRGLNATSNETWREVLPGKTTLLNITLNNTGNADDKFNVTIIREGWTINDSWSPTVGGSGVTNPIFNSIRVPTIGHIDVKKNESKNVTLQVRAPENATNGSYTFRVAMKSEGDLDGNARCKANETLGEGICTLTFTIHLAQVWTVSPIEDVPARVVPGEPVTYNIGIQNDGNGYDNVSLELQTTHFGWDVRLSDTVARLTPFNRTTFTLTVTSPPNIAENTVAAFFVNATSGGPQDVPFESRSKVSLQSTMTILRGPNMRIDVPVNSSFVDAGASATYTLHVANVGNVADNFTFPTPQRPSDWGVEIEPTYLELQPNQGGDVRVTLRAPTGATVGEKANAIVKVVSTVESSREKSVTLEGRVSGPDLFVDSVLVNSTSPYTGDPVEVSVVLGNSGNKGADKNVTLRLYFVQDGVERVIGEKLYAPLAIPGQRRLVEVFPWDTTGIEGSGVLLARIDVDDLVPEIDDSAASNEKTRALTLRTFDIKLTPAQGLTARPGEKLVYGEAPNVFLVRYDGNQPSESVTIRFESEHGWLVDSSGEPVDFVEYQIALPRGTPIPAIATLAVPTIPGTGKDILSITVTPSLRPAETLRASATTTILDEENPRVTRITATPASVRLGDRVTIDVHVEDATGVSAVTAYVVLPTNETQSMVLARAADGRWNGTQTFGVAGAYRVTAEVADAADPPNINRTRLTVGTFTVSAGSAPTVKLADGQGTTIRTGSPIRLDITDPLGVGKVTYSIRGVVYDLRGPGYQIDTSTFAAGPVDIIVNAENIYGVSTSQRFAFTVDNTPPGITKVTMSPQRPVANQQVTLTISTEPTVDAVEVLVKRDGQVVQSLNASRKGAGTFEVSFDTPEGEYRIDVTARDGAGNTKLAESAVVFSAKPGSPFNVPGPSLVVLLALVALAGLLVRRKA